LKEFLGIGLCPILRYSLHPNGSQADKGYIFLENIYVYSLKQSTIYIQEQTKST